MSEEKNELVLKRWIDIKGSFCPEEEVPLVDVKLVDNVFVVPSTCENRNILFKKFAFGRFLGDNLILSTYETFFLKEVLNCINFDFSNEELWNFCCKISGEDVFPRQYFVYKYYRINMWVVRDGSVFGTEFVLYADHQDVVHSSFLLSVMNDWGNIEKECMIKSRIGWTLAKKCVISVVKIEEGTSLSTPECLDHMELEAVIVKRLKFR